MRQRNSGSAAILALSSIALGIIARKIAHGTVKELDERWGERIGIRSRNAVRISFFAEPRSVALETILLALGIPRLKLRERTSVVLASSLAGLAGHALKWFIPRERPNKRRFTPEGGQSFPSTHTAYATALAITFARIAYRHRAGARGPILALAPTVAALIGIERVRCGAHWPTDVAAGALLGLIASSAADIAPEVFAGGWRQNK